SREVFIRFHHYRGGALKEFMRGLLGLAFPPAPVGHLPRPAPDKGFQNKKKQATLTVKRLFERLNAYLSADTVVVADVGEALFGAIDLYIRQRTEFLGPAYYASMGFAVPASIGVQLANPKLRPLVLVGDGAFQMTGMEL